MFATLVLVLRIALAVALYAFLGWALWTLLQEIRQQGNKISSQKKPGISLYVKVGNGAESQRYFSQAEVLIGRDTHCDLSVMDDALSAHHARLTHHHGQWWLEDLHSKNGTLLNHEKLSTPAVIITGDQFKCGNTVFDIRVELNDKLSPAEEM